MAKGPGLIKTAQALMAKHDFKEDKFKILMVNHLQRELPEFQELYQAILADLMAGKPVLE